MDEEGQVRHPQDAFNARYSSNVPTASFLGQEACYGSPLSSSARSNHHDAFNEIYHTNIPKAKFLIQDSFHGSPLSALNSPRHALQSLVSPRTFDTARSSLASYATAASGSQSGMGLFKKRAYYKQNNQSHMRESSTADLLTLSKLVDSFTTRISAFYPEGSLQSRNSEAFRKYLERILVPFSLPNSHKLENEPSPCQIVNRILKHSITGSKAISPGINPSTRELLRQELVAILGHQVTCQATIGQVFSSEWIDYLRTRGILLDTKDELDWSGRGQHVEYQLEDENAIPLKTERLLGCGTSAIVESVMCRRIRLARKKIRCRGRLTKKEAIQEVEHLQRLQHTHIVRVVGTYTLKKDLAILLYPATECNLEDFMDDLQDDIPATESLYTLEHFAINNFFGCLSHAIDFIHSQNVKHMDIKPKNLLVRRRIGYAYKIYIADFGIARSYKSREDCETDSPISFTRAYAAPEVIMQDTRGFGADIFSLGCVFMEMFATRFNQREELLELRLKNPTDTTFQANIASLLVWHHEQLIASLENSDFTRHYASRVLFELVPSMLATESNERPSAETLKFITADLGCSECDSGSEPFEAAQQSDPVKLS